MPEPLKIRFNPEFVAACREFNRQIAAIDWTRHRDALAYALSHGGNLPPGYLQDRRDADPDTSGEGAR